MWLPLQKVESSKGYRGHEPCTMVSVGNEFCGEGVEVEKGG
jgi:hypothetical protein